MMAGIGTGLGTLAGGIAGGFAGGPAGAGLGGSLGGFAGNWLEDLFRSGGKDFGLGSAESFISGNPGGFEQVSSFAPWQQQYFQQLAQMGQQGLQNPYQGFEDIANYSRNQFQNTTLPSLAERFAGLGSNALSSDAFQTQNQQAAKDLELGLAALRSQYGMQNRGQFANLLGMGLTPQYQNVMREGTPGAGASLFSQAAPALGKLGANAIGGYLGAGKGKGWEEANSAIINGLKGI